jgi:hypothetical protein
METISIRRKGYPIRHLFRDFVDRYRILGVGIGPSHREGDCRSAADKICKTVLANQDYQIGRTKVFLKVSSMSTSTLLSFLFGYCEEQDLNNASLYFLLRFQRILCRP